jgi:peptidoglycan-associated lipoprotein
MSRPEGAVRWYRGVQLKVGVIAVAGFAALSLAAAAAESGSSELQPRLVAETQEAGSMGEPAAAADDSGPEDQRARELFLDGMEKLAAGRTEWAQRTFESVIARFPGSQAAARARRELGAIYRSGAAPQVAGPDTGKADPAVQGHQAQPIGANPAWEQELRRNASIQTMLRNEAGDRVFFSVGSAELGARARTALAAQAQWLNRWREFEAVIEGHADEPGTDAENLQLSATRAGAVRQRLLAEGVDASRLVVVAQGRSQRVAICADAGCNAQNRRTVTLVFTSGTRARLGLSDQPATAQLGASQPGTLAATPAAPPRSAEERVGVAH